MFQIFKRFPKSTSLIISPSSNRWQVRARNSVALALQVIFLSVILTTILSNSFAKELDQEAAPIVENPEGQVVRGQFELITAAEPGVEIEKDSSENPTKEEQARLEMERKIDKLANQFYKSNFDNEGHPLAALNVSRKTSEKYGGFFTEDQLDFVFAIFTDRAEEYLTNLNHVKDLLHKITLELGKSPELASVMPAAQGLNFSPSGNQRSLLNPLSPLIMDIPGQHVFFGSSYYTGLLTESQQLMGVYKPLELLLISSSLPKARADGNRNSTEKDLGTKGKKEFKIRSGAHLVTDYERQQLRIFLAKVVNLIIKIELGINKVLSSPSVPSPMRGAELTELTKQAVPRDEVASVEKGLMTLYTIALKSGVEAVISANEENYSPQEKERARRSIQNYQVRLINFDSRFKGLVQYRVNLYQQLASHLMNVVSVFKTNYERPEDLKFVLNRETQALEAIESFYTYKVERNMDASPWRYIGLFLQKLRRSSRQISKMSGCFPKEFLSTEEFSELDKLDIDGLSKPFMRGRGPKDRFSSIDLSVPLSDVVASFIYPSTIQMSSIYDRWIKDGGCEQSQNNASQSKNPFQVLLPAYESLIKPFFGGAFNSGYKAQARQFSELSEMATSYDRDIVAWDETRYHQPAFALGLYYSFEEVSTCLIPKHEYDYRITDGGTGTVSESCERYRKKRMEVNLQYMKARKALKRK